MTCGGDFLTLGLESSCDDTAVAVLRGARDVRSELLSSQTLDHAPFGGVVPEFAARRHLEAFLPLTAEALRRAGVREPRDEIGLVAVTSGPGLMGALMVGVMAAKALALAWDKPIIGVNHLEGHIFANVVSFPDLLPPFLCMIVSGGHTEIVLVRDFGDYVLLGGTRDDAAGEAYDKVAKALGLSYPGGPVIDSLAASGDPAAFDFPLPLRGSQEVEFSFSGLKTAAATLIGRMTRDGGRIPLEDFCASFQRAVTEALMNKLRLASRLTGVRSVSVSGGVAANSALREALRREPGWRVCIPPRDRCTDNAVMIAAAGYAAYQRGERSSLSLAPDPSWEIWKK